MPQHIVTDEIEGFREKLESLSSTKLITYFSASLVDGKPWCPDCAAGDPVVLKGAECLANDVNFLLVRVDRTYWKGSPNAFKEEFGIKCLPTLKRWGQGETLGEDACKSVDQVKTFFEKQNSN